MRTHSWGSCQGSRPVSGGRPHGKTLLRQCTARAQHLSTVGPAFSHSAGGAAIDIVILKLGGHMGPHILRGTFRGTHVAAAGMSAAT